MSETPMGHAPKANAIPTFPLLLSAHPSEEQALPPHKHPAEQVMPEATRGDTCSYGPYHTGSLESLIISPYPITDHGSAVHWILP